jgi:hypothetical protein
MAYQRFAPDTREALWRAHGKRCFHCPRLIELDEVVIDHFVPESISVADLRRLQSSGAVPPGFNVRNEGNLAPSCEPCNRKKHDRQLTNLSVEIGLGKIRGRLSKYHEELKARKTAKSVGKIIADINRAVKNKTASRSQIMRAFRRNEVNESVGVAIPVDKNIFTAQQVAAGQMTVSERARSELENEGLDQEGLSSLIIQSALAGKLTPAAQPSPQGRLILDLGDGIHLHFQVGGVRIILERINFRSV